MKKTILLFLISISLFSCENTTSSDEIEQSKQESLLKESVRESGMPAIKNFLEKKTCKRILEMRDDNKTINYAYVYSEVSGKFTFLGKCIGFPIPYSTQYTNPEKFEYHQNGNSTLPQADPNGLFSPASSDGTWILLINEKTHESNPVYIEPKVTVSPFPLPKEICTNNNNNN